MNSLITVSDQETKQAGKSFSKKLEAGDIVCLYGKLGAGKTTFVKGIAEGLGITSRIISPTFVIIREHHIPETDSTIKRLYHLDLYRLQSEKEVTGIDLHDIFQDSAALVIIEWPEVAQAILPQKRWEVSLSEFSRNKRKIEINKYE